MNLTKVLVATSIVAMTNAVHIRSTTEQITPEEAAEWNSDQNDPNKLDLDQWAKDQDHAATNSWNTTIDAFSNLGNTIGNGTVSTANTVASGTVSAANTVASGTVSAANTVASSVSKTAKKVGKKIKNLFKLAEQNNTSTGSSGQSNNQGGQELHDGRGGRRGGQGGRGGQQSTKLSMRRREDESNEEGERHPRRQNDEEEDDEERRPRRQDDEETGERRRRAQNLAERRRGGRGGRGGQGEDQEDVSEEDIERFAQRHNIKSDDLDNLELLDDEQFDAAVDFIEVLIREEAQLQELLDALRGWAGQGFFDESN